MILQSLIVHWYNLFSTLASEHWARSQTSLTLTHLFLLTCIISYHGALSAIFYITTLIWLIPKPQKLAFKSSPLHIACLGGLLFSYLLWMLSFFWNRAGFCILAVYELVVIAFLSKCNCISWKFTQAQFAYVKPFDDYVNYIHIRMNSNSTLCYLAQRYQDLPLSLFGVLFILLMPLYP